MTLYEELQARGLVAQITDNEIIDLINNGKATFYIGFDCTADSLTAGHFMALTLMKRLQMAGNKPLWPYRYAQDADQGGHCSQCSLLQEADGEVHRFL